MDLAQKVIDRINLLGQADAAAFFGVSPPTISNWLTKRNPPLSAAQKVISDSPEPAQTEPEPLTMWEGRKVAMLLPAYKTINPDTHFTLFANYVKYGPDKIAMPRPVKGTCIWEARNIMVNKAHKTMPEVQSFIMSDDDMIHPFGYADNFNQMYGSKLPANLAGAVAISRLMSHGSAAGIVGCTYFGRHGKGRPQNQLGFKDSKEGDKFRQYKYTGLVPMEWVGTGLIRIERWVIDKLKAEIDGGRWPECRGLSLGCAPLELAHASVP